MNTKYRVSVMATLAIVGGVALGFGSARAGARDDSLAGARAAVARFAGALRANDPKAMARLLLHDRHIVGFGTDKAERWVGYDELMKSLGAQLAAFRTTGVAVRDEVVHLTPRKDGAYFSEIWDWKIAAEGKNMALKNLRVTGVLVRSHRHWRLAQFHISMPAGGQAVPY